MTPKKSVIRRSLLGLPAVCAMLPLLAAQLEGQASVAVASKEGSLRYKIWVKVKNLGALQADLQKQTDPAKQKPVLFLDGREITGVFGWVGGKDPETLLFDLERTTDNRDAWKPLLSRPSLSPRKVRISVGVPGGNAISSNTDFELTVLHGGWLMGWGGLLVFLVLVLTFHAGTRGKALDALRESGPVAAGKKAALSLGRCQMAMWSVAVVLAFIFLYMVTWDYDTITQGTLVLIGISAGTGFAGAIVDSSKNSGMAAQKTSLQAELAAATPPSAARAAAINQQITSLDTQMATPLHTDYISDLLTDANGISFHRMQIAAWTIILVVIFGITVYSDLLMPDFSANLLGLMGISSGTYVGFKFPENKN